MHARLRFMVAVKNIKSRNSRVPTRVFERMGFQMTVATMTQLKHNIKIKSTCNSKQYHHQPPPLHLLEGHILHHRIHNLPYIEYNLTMSSSRIEYSEKYADEENEYRSVRCCCGWGIRNSVCLVPRPAYCVYYLNFRCSLMKREYSYCD